MWHIFHGEMHRHVEGGSELLEAIGCLRQQFVQRLVHLHDEMRGLEEPRLGDDGPERAIDEGRDGRGAVAS